MRVCIRVTVYNVNDVKILTTRAPGTRDLLMYSSVGSGAQVSDVLVVHIQVHSRRITTSISMVTGMSTVHHTCRLKQYGASVQLCDCESIDRDSSSNACWKCNYIVDTREQCEQ